MLTKKPLVLHVHSLAYDREGATFRKGSVFPIEKRTLEHADAIIAVSEYTKAVLTAHYGVSPSRVTVVHNALGLEPLSAETAETVLRRRRAGREKEHVPLVSFVGRLTAQKNPLGFVRIAERVAAAFPQAQFCMAGTGDMEIAVNEAIEKAGLTPKFQLSGFLDRSAVYDLLERTDVFVMPSVSEPFGLVAMEAALSGALCVLSRQSGVLEVLGNVPSSDYRDEDAFVEMIVTALEAPYRHVQFVENAYRKAQQRTWRQAAGEVTALYQQFLSI